MSLGDTPDVPRDIHRDPGDIAEASTWSLFIGWSAVRGKKRRSKPSPTTLVQARRRHQGRTRNLGQFPPQTQPPRVSRVITSTCGLRVSINAAAHASIFAASSSTRGLLPRLDWQKALRFEPEGFLLVACRVAITNGRGVWGDTGRVGTPNNLSLPWSCPRCAFIPAARLADGQQHPSQRYPGPQARRPCHERSSLRSQRSTLGQVCRRAARLPLGPSGIEPVAVLFQQASRKQLTSELGKTMLAGNQCKPAAASNPKREC